MNYPRASFFTLGCKLNQAETAAVKRHWMERKVALPFEDGKNSDVIFINTCAVTERASAKSRQLIARVARDNPGAIVVASGCLAEADLEQIASIPEVDHILGMGAKFSMAWSNSLGKFGAPESKHLSGSPDSISLDRSRPLLKIQDGCDQNCSYCIIPLLRGGQRSVPRDEIIRQAKQFLSAGAGEIVLTGVRIGSWGEDLQDDCDLTSLLIELAALSPIHRIRLGSLEPWELSDDIVDLAVNHGSICQHLHVPVQHTDPHILAAMNRPPLGDALLQIKHAKRLNPDIAVGVDIIVGFPGESESMFKRLYRDLESLPVTYIHTFGYSRRPGTPAAGYADQVQAAQIKKRVSGIKRLSEVKQKSFLASQLGAVRTAIPDKPRPGSKWTRVITDNYLHIRIPCESVVAGKKIDVTIKLDDLDRAVGIPDPVGR